MKTKILSALSVLAIATALTGVAQAQPAVADGNAAVEVVDFKDTPLTEGIKALAKQASLKIIFAPALLNQNSAVLNEKWRNVTPLQALQALLDNHGWQMTQEPGSIARISAKDPNTAGPQRTKVNLSETVPANGAAAEEVQSIISFDDIPLPEVIQMLALKAGLNVQLDPLLAKRQDQVTAKWKNLTTRQALQALLDNWSLEMTQIPGNPIFRVEASKTPNAGRPPDTIVNLLANSPAIGIAGNAVPIKLEDIPLTVAIQALGRQAELNIIFDPTAFNQIQFLKVSEKWENITPRQALQALLDKHGLQVMGQSGVPILRVVSKNP